MGKDHTKLDVVYDTGSDWLVLEGNKCFNCKGDTYDGDGSGIRHTNKHVERKYGSVILMGHEYSDMVCLNPRNDDTCIDSFKYYLIEESKRRGNYRGMVEPVDGLMGMARPELPSEEMLSVKTRKVNYDVGEIFYKELANNNKTDEINGHVFAFYFTRKEGQSFIDFNGYLLYNIKD